MLEVVRANYDTLTLKLQDGLDQYERYSEQHKEAAFFKELVSEPCLCLCLCLWRPFPATGFCCTGGYRLVKSDWRGLIELGLLLLSHSSPGRTRW